MNDSQIIQYILSFLGGGVVAAVGNWVATARNAARDREIERLKEQIEGLYGPLFFFTSQNEQLFKLNERIAAAYSHEFSGMKLPEDPKAREALDNQMNKTIDLENEYARLAVANDDRMIAILERGWHLIEPTDIPLFANFQVQYARLRTEIYSERPTKPPLRISTALGPIHFMPQELIEHVRTEVARKQRRLIKLTQTRWWQFGKRTTGLRSRGDR